MCGGSSGRIFCMTITRTIPPCSAQTEHCLWDALFCSSSVCAHPHAHSDSTQAHSRTNLPVCLSSIFHYSHSLSSMGFIFSLLLFFLLYYSHSLPPAEICCLCSPYSCAICCLICPFNCSLVH